MRTRISKIKPNALLLLCVLIVVGCSGNSSTRALADEDCPEESCPEVTPGQPTFSEVREVEIRIVPDCARRACREKGDCNERCINVTPTHAKLFYDKDYRLGETPDDVEDLPYTPGRARQVRWVVRCYSKMDGTGGRDCEREGDLDCITRLCEDGVYDAVLIKPVQPEDMDAKRDQMREKFKNVSRYERHGQLAICREPNLFQNEFTDDGSFVIKAPFNTVFSGLPVEPPFVGKPDRERPRRLEWFYDVEVVKNGKTIIRLDPEIWLEEDD